MKTFSVDEKKCVACGACLSYSDYFVEDSTGKAKSNLGSNILEQDLIIAEEISSLCPTNAISIVEVKSNGSIDNILKDLKSELLDCLITYKESSTFTYDRNKYQLAYPESPNFYGSDYKYSSDSKAVNAGLEEFDRYVYSRYRKIILELFVQYKLDKIYPYYDFSEESFIGKRLDKIRSILNKYSGLINANLNNRVIPIDFDCFNLDFENDDFKMRLKDVSEFERFSTSSGVWADFQSGSYSSLSSYKSYIDTDDFEEYIGSGLFGDKYKTRYCHRSLKEVVAEFYSDIQLSMSSVDLDEKAAMYVNLFIRSLNYLLLDIFVHKFIEIERLTNKKYKVFDDIKPIIDNNYTKEKYLESIIGEIDKYLY